MRWIYFYYSEPCTIKLMIQVKSSQKCFIAIQEKVYIDQNNKTVKPIRLICPTHLRISLRNIDLILVQQVSRECKGPTDR